MQYVKINNQEIHKINVKEIEKEEKLLEEHVSDFKQYNFLSRKTLEEITKGNKQIELLENQKELLHLKILKNFKAKIYRENLR